jgi:hypothetical protein
LSYLAAWFWMGLTLLSPSAGLSATFDGSTVTLSASDHQPDNTALIQSCLDNEAFTKIIIEPGPRNASWRVRPLFILHDNTEIHLNDGVVLEAARKGYPGSGDCLLRADHLTHVRVTGDAGARILMHKEEYARLPASEYRHALSFGACSQVVVDGLTLAAAGGDGIYLGDPDDNEGYCSDVTINNVTTDACARNGMSVISVDGLIVTHCTFKNTKGKGKAAADGPWAGIDLEPNSPGQRLKNIVIDDCTMLNNGADGFDLSAANLWGSTDTMSITVRNCVMQGNALHGIRVTNVPGTLSSDSHTLFESCVIRDNKDMGVVIESKAKDAGPLTLADCRLINNNTARGKSPLFIYSFTETSEVGGNIQLDDVVIEQTRKRSAKKVPYCLWIDGTYSLIDGVSGNIRTNGGTLEVVNATNVNVTISQ